MAIVGPTASGKSAVAMTAARQLGDVELVSIDSMQVYRGMNIGTAKPTEQERREVPHHLLDLVEPQDDFTVAEFRDAYATALAGIGRRGAQALLVGGTGLYHRVVIDDFDLPGQWPDIRASWTRSATPPRCTSASLSSTQQQPPRWSPAIAVE